MIDEKYKVSIEYYKKFLSDRGENFSDEQIREIRKFLYILAEVAIEDLKQQGKLSERFLDS